jgi:hypothetical protein
MLKDTAFEVLRQLWEINGKLDRITDKLDSDDPKPALDLGKAWIVLAAVGVSLLLPAEKQAAVLALLK